MDNIDPNEYMVDGWDSAEADTKYVRGSLYNKIGMTVTWTYYVLILGMAIRLAVVLNSN
jgi:hypothetical protein